MPYVWPDRLIKNIPNRNAGDVNVKVAEEESEEVDFKDISQSKALELLKVGLGGV